MESSGNDDVFDVIVVGAGVMGSSTAYQTSKRGHKTLLLEQFDFLHHRGSSHGESRTIRATYPEDYYSQMVIQSSELWKKDEAEVGYKVYFESCQLDFGPADQKSLNSIISNCQKQGISHQILDHLQIFEKFSGSIKIEEDWVGLVSEIGGIIKPTKAVAMFQALALKNEAVLKDNMAVIAIDRVAGDGEILVSTRSGERFRGRKCVVTVGAWMKKLVKSVSGLDLPIQPLETTVCYWRIKEGFEEKFTMGAGYLPTIASYGKPYIYGTPSFEYPGLIKIAVHNGRPCDPDKRPWSKGVQIDELRKWIEDRFSGLVDSSDPVVTQSCMYSVTPDEDFVIDFLGGEFSKDVVIGGGFSGHGFKMAPVVGRILADLALEGEARNVELKHFRIKRFEENPKGNVKDGSSLFF